ncbi:hypothetical protein ACG33_01345 [Steroidobacter denitrificans]|uniref:Uncharacterized protein n=1 Tax=Steroidobacter denitrificans TaxID=465721 RepID=A0A127F814_STEDE|nr:hypothetical protein [Steroidobacter denitrificans]AMN45771.1 hypothetical protein ACG33_01345 [Steroidobacter denitrificans]
MNTMVIVYRFTLPDSRERVFELEMDRDTALLAPIAAPEPPAWTELAFNQCQGCPLQVAEHSHCPAALHLSGVIDGFTDLVSYDKVRVTVESEERSVVATLSAQQALASLMGLIMASSGCPRTAVFRPMARFHLPFSSESETAYRVASMYLVAQHFIARSGGPADFALDDLEGVYRGVHAVNRGMAQRLRAASRQDAIVNAVVLLDVYSSLVPAAIHDLLDEIKPAFAALLLPDSSTVA